jgi:hypothetical protein
MADVPTLTFVATRTYKVFVETPQRYNFLPSPNVFQIAKVFWIFYCVVKIVLGLDVVCEFVG